MSKKGTNIYKRKDGRWEGRYTKGYDDNGKRIWGFVYAKTYREALEKKLQAQEPYLKCKADKNDPLFQNVAKSWLTEKKVLLKPSSYARYEHFLNSHILPEFGRFRCGQIDAGQIDKYLMKKQAAGQLHSEKGLSQRTVTGIYGMIRNIMFFAESTYHIKTNIHQMHSIHIKNVPGNVFTVTSLLRLKNAAELEYREDLRCLGILFCMYTGLRVGELCALKWSDIHMDTRVVCISRTIQRLTRTEKSEKKTYLCEGSPKTITSKREIPICEELYRVLDEYSSVYEKNAYFLSGRTEKCVEPRNFQYYFKRFQEKHEIEPLNCHALRHTFATIGIASGIDVKTVSELLGHSSVNITLNYYVHTSMEQKKKQIELLKYS